MYPVYFLIILTAIAIILLGAWLFRAKSKAKREYQDARDTCHSAVEATLLLPTITREWILFNGFVRYVEGRGEEIANAVLSSKCSRIKAIELFDVMHAMILELIGVRTRLQMNASISIDTLKSLLRQTQQELLRIEHCDANTKMRAKQLGSIKSSVLDVERRIKEESSDLLYDFMILEISLIHLRYFDLMTSDL